MFTSGVKGHQPSGPSSGSDPGAVGARIADPPSSRLLETPRPITYPTHFEVRWVSQLGNIRWHKQFVFVSRMFKYEPIGLEQLNPGLWAVFYSFHHLGWLDEKYGRIVDRRGKRRRRANPDCKPSGENLL
jgi:hypothetical protein